MADHGQDLSQTSRPPKASLCSAWKRCKRGGVSGRKAEARFKARIAYIASLSPDWDLIGQSAGLCLTPIWSVFGGSLARTAGTERARVAATKTRLVSFIVVMIEETLSQHLEMIVCWFLCDR